MPVTGDHQPGDRGRIPRRVDAPDLGGLRDEGGDRPEHCGGGDAADAHALSREALQYLKRDRSVGGVGARGADGVLGRVAGHPRPRVNGDQRRRARWLHRPVGVVGGRGGDGGDSYAACAATDNPGSAVRLLQDQRWVDDRLCVVARRNSRCASVDGQNLARVGA